MSRTRVLAVASGKGGVGKTLTAVNIALTAAREGVRTALVDADPLSNVMTMLDHRIPDRPLPDRLDDPAAQAFIVAPGFEVIFPQTKRSAKQASILVGDLLSRHRQWLESRYGLVLVDLPAGSEVESEFPYLVRADALLLVTTPEPTSHAAAGAFLKNALPLWNDRPIYLWHNRYESHPDDEFDSDDLVGNFNRNVDESYRIEDPGLRPVAWVPPDPALDLTRTDPPILLNLHRSLVDTLQAMADAAIPPLPAPGSTGFRSGVLIAHLLRRSDPLADPDTVIRDIENAVGARLPERMKVTLRGWIDRAASNPLRRQVLQAMEVVRLHIDRLENRTGGDENELAMSARTVDREIIPLLKTLACLPPDSRLIGMASLLLFRYAVARLFAHRSAEELITGFLPRREENGQSVRDRRTQIVRMVGRDSAYQERYFALVKRLHPVLMKQIDRMAGSYGLESLLFREAGGDTARAAYVRLFSATIYELVNSGLGIVAGFRFRPSSRAFRDGFDTLRRQLIELSH